MTVTTRARRAARAVCALMLGGGLWAMPAAAQDRELLSEIVGAWSCVSEQPGLALTRDVVYAPSGAYQATSTLLALQGEEYIRLAFADTGVWRIDADVLSYQSETISVLSVDSSPALAARATSFEQYAQSRRGAVVRQQIVSLVAADLVLKDEAGAEWTCAK